MRRRAAFSLIELLVVVAIIAILIGLLLPAVQKVREAAMRMKCLNNMKQLALGTQSYHDAQGRYPPAMAYLPGAVTPATPPAHTWAAFILPTIEQDALYQLYQWDRLWDDPANAPVASAVLSAFACPSAPVPVSRPSPNGGAPYYGAGDYGPITDVDQALIDTGVLAPWDGLARDGAMCAGRSANLVEITDGSSHTILLAEIAGRPFHFGPSTRRLGMTTAPGGWAVAANPNVINFDGWMPDGSGPNGTCAINCDNRHEVYSFHPGGANVAMCDGAVRFVRASVGVASFAAAVTRAGGETLGLDD